MTEFKEGHLIPISIGGEAKILSKLGEGGQGLVYLAEYMGTEYALKWYRPNIFTDPDAFYENLANNIRIKAPCKNFLWPQFLTEKYFGSFGYLMELRPKEYTEFSQYLLARRKFNSVSQVINAALGICECFAKLHRKGFSYQDLNDSNFFIDDIGNVLICDNDNAAPYGSSLGIAGKCRYMAPEVVKNLKRPDIHTDRFSLAVILFRLLYIDHPLEGERTMCPCLTEQLEYKFYGSEPVFLFDETDYSNRAVRGIHSNALTFWKLYPQFVKDKFIKAFSKDVMLGGKPRITENEWIEVFRRLRRETVLCPRCTNETFVSCESVSKCINCGGEIPIPPVMTSGCVKMPLFPGAEIYLCDIIDSNSDIFVKCGEVIRNPKNPAIWGLRNVSDKPWKAVMIDGTSKIIDKNQVMLIVKTKSVEICGNCLSVHTDE